MSKTNAASEQDSVTAEIQIAAPPDRVFQALTDDRDLIRWFTDPSCPTVLWEMDARPGGCYCHRTQKGNVVVNGVDEFECHGEILELDPPRLLVYTWIANWHVDKSLPTVVRWELTPVSGGTHVKVTHCGLTADPASRKDYSGGWPGALRTLKEFIEK